MVKGFERVRRKVGTRPGAVVVLIAWVAVLGLCAPARAEVTRSGTLQAIVADNFRTAETTTRYLLRSGAQETPLRPTALAAEPGDRVVVSGEMRAGKLTGEVEALSESTPPAALAAPRKVAVVLVRFAGDPAQPWAPSVTRSKIFTATDSANAFYKEESHGDISLAGKLNPNGDVFGWLSIDAPTTGCPFMQWSNAADAAAADAGIDLSGYDHVMYVVPSRAGCGWLGIAEVGGSWSMINGNQGVHPIAHELGHNLGLEHAGSWTCTDGGVRVPVSDTCTTTEYGDPFDVMGNIAPRHSNGWNLEQLGIPAPENVETVEASGSYSLRAALNPTSETTALRVPATGFPGKMDSWYYLEVRQTGGVFENVVDASMTGVSIRATQTFAPTTVLLDTNPATASFADAPLKVGQTFDAGGVSITTVAAGGGGATVSIELDEEPPTAPTGLTATAGTAGVRLQWNASSDNLGVERYVVFRDGEQIGAPTETSFTDSLAIPGEHTYVVHAEDETRNQSAGSEPATVTLAAVEGPECEAGECTVAFGYTGAPAGWTVPLGVSEARFIVEGAQGGDSSAGLVDGGARASATIESLATGAEATLIVGGKGESHAEGGTGGFGGGGDGTRGGGGGGASSVEIDSTLMLIAAGGGGGGLAGSSATGVAPAGGRGGRGGEIGTNGFAGVTLSAHGATLGGGVGGMQGGDFDEEDDEPGGEGGKGGAVTGASSCGSGVTPGAPGAAGGDLSGGGGAPNAGGGGGGGHVGGGQGGGGAGDACGNSAGSGGGGGGSSYGDESLSWGVTGGARRGYGRALIVYPNPVVAADHSFMTMPGQELVVPGAEGVRAGASGPDGAPLSLSLVDPAAHGTLTLEDDGSFIYEPDLGYTGIDSFTYRLDHPSGHYAIAEVTIRVPADPSALISSPPGGGTYELDQAVPTTFKCTEGAGGTGLDSCDDSRGKETVSGGKGSLDTSTLGSHTYTVTAVSKTGLTDSASITYEVTPKKPTPPQDPDEPPDDPGGPPKTPDTPPRTPDPPPPVADTTAPETRIGAGPARKTKRKRVRFEFSSSEPGSTFACKLGRRPFKPCTSGVEYKVAPGRHVFKVRATDAAGNDDPTPATVRWKVER